MTKFLLGVAIGYVFSNILDELLGRANKEASKVADEDKAPEPSPMETQP